MTEQSVDFTKIDCNCHFIELLRNSIEFFVGVLLSRSHCAIADGRLAG